MKNILSWLETLVNTPTVSADSNLEFIHLIEQHFQQYGLKSWRTWNSDRTKANIVGTIPAADGSVQGGIVLSGHTDVVPVANQPWTTHPFTLTRNNNQLFGRGTADMKGFIACCLSGIPAWSSLALKKPLHFAFSYDEEVGCLGAPKILEGFKQQGILPEGCIIGEPTQMQVVSGHKGIQVMRCRIHGKAAHSSLTPQGANAIYYASQLIQFLQQYAKQLERAESDTSYDVPFTTLSVNQITGGVAMNTVPEHCELVYEFRNLPFISTEHIQNAIDTYIQEQWLPSIKEEYPDVAITLEKIASVPGLHARSEVAFQALVRTLLADNEHRNIGFTTEAGLFQQAGIPTLICGPGDIRVAHAANEYIEIEQLEMCQTFLAGLVDALTVTTTKQ